MKARARRAAQELAGELLNLYAERRRRRGHAFPEDGEWLREFEARFPYQETPDQREAIEHVKADMERAQPMDRLICGDVGYGKTEVALRAAFKAADDGKQVLVLAPTTILAQQHFGTFSERLKRLPVHHRARQPLPLGRRAARGDRAASTRAASTSSSAPTACSAATCAARTSGCMIVDEEQRFGVKQKELLRQLKLKVDVIAMSATPIPRTLQMSLAGMRDISVIETPPEGRRPVKTYVGEYDEELVKQALDAREGARRAGVLRPQPRRDDRRDGRAPARRCARACASRSPTARWTRSTLEQRMLSFLRGEADVLVATSIIESGIDIPQANTLIVERADIFGLAQLYQIRGRVGPLARARLRLPALPQRGRADARRRPSA